MLTFNQHVLADLPRSPDYLFRERVTALATLGFEHLYTVEDLTVLEDTRTDLPSHPVTAGTTEWQCNVGGRTLSLGWDWARLHDGAVRLLAAVPPRSNIQVIDAKGYELAHDEAGAALTALVASFDWERQVQHQLHGRRRLI